MGINSTREEASMSATDLSRKSVAELGQALATGSVSAVELARSYLDRIERHKDLNAFLPLWRSGIVHRRALVVRRAEVEPPRSA